MNQNTYSIYKFTFSDGKIYIGQTSQLVEKRWNHGEGYQGQKVYIPIILEGWDNIQKEILHTNLSLEQANKLEKYYIKLFNSIKNGYNNDDGGKNSNSIRKVQIPIITSDYFLSQCIPKWINKLSNSEFKLLFYFYYHQNQTLVIMPSLIKEEIHLSENTIHSCIRALIEHRILLYDSTNNIYNFLI